MRLPILFLLLSSASIPVLAQDEEAVTALEVAGRITDGEKNLEGVLVYAMIDNVRVDSLKTTGNGKFGMLLDLQKEHMLEFKKEGYVVKRMLIDLRVKARPGQELVVAPIDMDVTLLDEQYYEGADTDVLDFPSAIVRWNKTQGAFAMDYDYTMGMARANGSVLLMAARTGTGKKK
ncbi:MAG: hypothetical protein ABI599_15120 [Flavobacteriales bacterium]